MGLANLSQSSYHSSVLSPTSQREHTFNPSTHSWVVSGLTLDVALSPVPLQIAWHIMEPPGHRDHSSNSPPTPWHREPQCVVHTTCAPPQSSSPLPDPAHQLSLSLEPAMERLLQILSTQIHRCPMFCELTAVSLQIYYLFLTVHDYSPREKWCST